MAGTIEIENDNLVFRILGIDKVLALKSEIRVPLKHVMKVSMEKAAWNYFSMLKVPSTRVPGVLVDGRFVGNDGLLFYEMHDPDKCVTVELKDETYREIVLTVADKPATARIIKRGIEES